MPPINYPDDIETEMDDDSLDKANEEDQLLEKLDEQPLDQN